MPNEQASAIKAIKGAIKAMNDSNEETTGDSDLDFLQKMQTFQKLFKKKGLSG